MLADIDNAALGLWIAAMFTFLGMVWLVRQIWVSFFPVPAPGSEYVTKMELQAALAELKSDVHEIKREVDLLKDEIHKSTILNGHLLEKLADTKEQIKEVRTYQSESTHRLANTLNQMNLQLATVQAGLGLKPTKSPTIFAPSPESEG